MADGKGPTGKGKEGREFKEFIASCPGCKTFETVWIRGGMLMPTKRFSQKGDGKVYHDCGCEASCQLFFCDYDHSKGGKPNARKGS